MKLAIMQPYAFPYLGYFQLIHAVDRFILLDNVNFIVRGYINRNQVLGPDGPAPFTIPVQDASQNRLIHDIDIADDSPWQSKLLKTLAQTYQNAPQYHSAFPLIEHLITTAHGNLAHFIQNSLSELNQYLQINTPVTTASTISTDPDLRAQDRILALCQHENASEYINAEGGRELYDAPAFHSHNIQLTFLEHTPVPYPQFKEPFVPRLSIIDALMFNSPEALAQRLTEYQLHPEPASS
ncbi:MAG: WbqC family protein [Verrucomicrobiota bacterium]